MRPRTALAAILALMPLAADGEDAARCTGDEGATFCRIEFANDPAIRRDSPGTRGSEGCSVTVDENRSADGSADIFEKAVCGDGSIRTAEHRYDSSGRLVAVREHEISAHGAVRLVAQFDRVSSMAVEARARGSEPAAREAASEEPDHEHTQAWLNAKFKEWKAAVEVQEASRARRHGAGSD